MTPEGASTPSQGHALRKLDIAVMRLLGPDIFISYRKCEAKYARALRDALEAMGYRCFLDQDWQPAGSDIETYKAFARRSRMFVLVGSQTILDSKHVPLELDAYDRRHAGWLSRHRRRIFPISVENTLADFESAEAGRRFLDTPWKSLLGLVSEPETASALINGQPSEDVPKHIARTYGLVRGTHVILAGLAALLMVILLAAVYAARERSSTEAYSRADYARKLPEHDEFGNPNTARMLGAIESWRIFPNPAAFQLISQSMMKVSLPMKTLATGLGDVWLVAIDPRGQKVAVSDAKMVKIFRRDGTEMFPGMQIDGLVEMRFAAASNELAIAVNSTSSGNQVIRLDTENGSEISRTSLGPKYAVALSPDGEWVAGEGAGGVEVIATRRQQPSKSFPYRNPCFADSGQVVMREEAAGGATKFVSRNFGPGSQLPELNDATDLKFIEILTCAGDWIVYHPVTGWPALYWRYDPKGSEPVLWSPSHVTFGNDVMAGISPGASSHLFGSAALGKWELIKYFSSATAIGFGPPHEFVTGGRDGSVTIWDYSDPRQLVDVPEPNPPALQRFEHHWASIPYKDPYFNSKLGNAGPLISPDKRWRAEREVNSVAIVDVASGYEILLLNDPYSNQGAFSVDGHAFALRGSLSVQAWSLDPEFYVRTLCQVLPRLYDPNWSPVRFQQACPEERQGFTGQ